MYFDCFNQRGRFREIMDNWFSHSVQIIVVTDGGRILGLGDLGEILPYLPKLPSLCCTSLHATGGVRPPHTLHSKGLTLLHCQRDTDMISGLAISQGTATR